MPASLGVLSGVGQSLSRRADMQLRQKLAEIAFQQQQQILDKQHQQRLESSRVDAQIRGQQELAAIQLREESAERTALFQDKLNDENQFQEVALGMAMPNLDFNNPDHHVILSKEIEKRFIETKQRETDKHELDLRVANAQIASSEQNIAASKANVELNRRQADLQYRSYIDARSDSIGNTINDILDQPDISAGTIREVLDGVVRMSVDNQGTPSEAIFHGVINSVPYILALEKVAGMGGTVESATNAYLVASTQASSFAAMQVFGTQEVPEHATPTDLERFRSTYNRVLDLQTQAWQSKYGEELIRLGEQNSDLSGYSIYQQALRSQNALRALDIGAPNPATGLKAQEISGLLMRSGNSPEALIELQAMLNRLRTESEVDSEIDFEWIINEYLPSLGVGDAQQEPQGGGIMDLLHGLTLGRNPGGGQPRQ